MYGKEGVIAPRPPKWNPGSGDYKDSLHKSKKTAW